MQSTYSSIVVHTLMIQYPTLIIILAIWKIELFAFLPYAFSTAKKLAAS